MIVYRIVKSKKRTKDLSGTGAYNVGGRWNNEGTYALYTSESLSLALLEILVHTDFADLPGDLYLITIEVNDQAPIYEFAEKDLPPSWRIPENIELKKMGDDVFHTNEFIGIKAPSAVMPREFNYIFNPAYPGYQKLLRVVKVEPLDLDKRLLKS